MVRVSPRRGVAPLLGALGQADEVLDGDGGVVREELDDDVAVVGLEGRDQLLATGVLSRWGPPSSHASPRGHGDGGAQARTRRAARYGVPMSKPRSPRRRRLLLLVLVGVGVYVLKQATRDQGGSYVPPGADDTLEVPADATADELRRSAPADTAPAAAGAVSVPEEVQDDPDVVPHEPHVELVPDEETTSRAAAVSVVLTREGGVAVHHRRGAAGQLYSRALHDAFDAALDEVEADLPRVLDVRARGRVVIRRVDVSEFHAQRTKPATKALYDRMIELPLRVAALRCRRCSPRRPDPDLGARGRARLRPARRHPEGTVSGLVERVIGLTPTMGGTQRSRPAPVRPGRRVVFTGDLYDAATFERWGVVNRVLEDDDFEAATLAYAARFADGPTKAFGAAKQVLRHLEAGGVAEADAHVTTIAVELFDTDDLQHGMASFLQDGRGTPRSTAAERSRQALVAFARIACVARRSAQKLTTGSVARIIVVSVKPTVQP